MDHNAQTSRPSSRAALEARLLGCVLAAAIVACGPEAAPDPRPTRVKPTHIAEGTSTPVEIFGEGFRPTLRTDFAHPDQSVLDATFQVFATPKNGGERLELEDVRFTEEHTLLTRVPAGLAQGSYDLTVVDAAGREGALRSAFEVVTPADAVSAFLISPIEAQRIGIPFLVSIIAIDEQGRTVKGFEGSVTVSDLSSTAQPAMLGPFVLGRFVGLVAIHAPSDSNVLTVLGEEGRTGVSDPFPVSPGSATALALVSAPERLAAGECSSGVQVGVIDSSAQPTVPETLIALQPTTGAADVAFFSDAACASPLAQVALTPASPIATLHVRARRAGPLAIRLGATSLPSLNLGLQVEPGAPARWVLDEMPSTLVVGDCSAAVAAQLEDAYGNSSPSVGARAIPLQSSPSTLSYFSDAACASPLAQPALTAGSARAVFHFRAGTAATHTLEIVPATGSGLIGDLRTFEVSP